MGGETGVETQKLLDLEIVFVTSEIMGEKNKFFVSNMSRCTNSCLLEYIHSLFSAAHKLIHPMSVELGGLSRKWCYPKIRGI